MTNSCLTTIDTVVTPYIWSQIEPTTAIICACLTTYRPLFKGLNLRSLSQLTWLSSVRSKAGTVDQGTLSSGRRSRLHEPRRASQNWSKFDFNTDVVRTQTVVSSVQELRTFQEMSSKGTNGGLRLYESVYDGTGAFKVDIEAQQEPPSKRESWLEHPPGQPEAHSRTEGV